MNFFMPVQPVFFNPFAQYTQFNFNYSAQNPVSIFQQSRRTSQHNTYNKAKGDLLIKNALKGLPDYEEDPPMCAKYVKNAIVKSGLGEYVKGNGEEAKYMLRQCLKCQKEQFLSMMPENPYTTLTVQPEKSEKTGM